MDSSASSPLVFTKLRVPVMRGRLIFRSHLVELLNTENGADFILVCAPAGYGKTTLLAEWAQSLIKNKITVIWYALDPGDDDPIPFRAYLVASFIQALGPLPELTRLSQLLRTAPEMDMQYILTVIINAILTFEGDCVLILDDYHLIGSPAIHSGLSYLLEHMPENLRLVIGSRSDPPLPLARLRARRQMVEIRTANLRFKADETAKFLNDLMQLGLSLEAVAELEDRTEGWVTGLQLAALSLEGRTDREQVMASFTGSHRYLVDYLMEEVVSSQSEEVQAFLMSTSILERLCAPLCDHILRENNQKDTVSNSNIPISPLFSNSQSVLEYLEKSNLFLVALDEEGVWYRYHHLFRDFLRNRLDKNRSVRIPALHRSACEWLAEHKLLREAAEHAFRTHDWDYAAAFVEQHNFTLIVHGDMATLYEWCSAFPEEVMQKRPMLCVLQALSLAYNFRRKNKPRIEARLRQVDQAISAMPDSQAVQGLVDLGSVVRTFLCFAPDPHANPREILALAQNMLDVYPEGNPGRFSGLLLTGYAYMALQDAQAAGHAFETSRQIALHEPLYFGIVESSFHLARLAYSQGQLRRAVEICHQGQADVAAVLPHSEQELPALGSLEVVLGCISMEQNRLDEAERQLRHGLELMGAGMNPIYLFTAYVALFRLYEILGRSTEAMKMLDHLEAAWLDISFATDGLRVIHLLNTASQNPDTLAAAENWCDRNASLLELPAPFPGMGPFGAAEAHYLAGLTWMQIQIATGKADSMRAYLAQQLEQASAHGLMHRVIELSLLDATVSHYEDDHNRAQVSLGRALGLAQPEGYISIFYQYPILIPLMKQTARQGLYRDYIEQILTSMDVMDGQYSRGETQALYGDSLSQRELEVLQLIAQGATNQEIADRFVISVGTVKSHINHILKKLDSHNRTEAVARARRLGLLHI